MNAHQTATSVFAAAGNQPTGNALLDFGAQTGNSLRWVVNVTAGEQ